MENRTGTGGSGQEAMQSIHYGTQIIDATQSGSSLSMASRPGSAEQEQSQTASPNLTIDLQVVPFYRGYDVHGAIKPYHWAILATAASGAEATVYQLRGMPGNFKYGGPEDEAVLNLLENGQQELEIGRIPTTEIKKLESSLELISVSQAEYGYNCQTWTEDALRTMESCGWLDYPCSAIVQWLKQLENQDPTSGAAANLNDN